MADADWPAHTLSDLMHQAVTGDPSLTSPSLRTTIGLILRSEMDVDRSLHKIMAVVDEAMEACKTDAYYDGVCDGEAGYG